MKNINGWLDDEQYAKLRGIAQLKISGILEEFNCMGFQHSIPLSLKNIMDVLDDFGLAVRGNPKPIGSKITARKRATEA